VVRALAYECCVRALAYECCVRALAYECCVRALAYECCVRALAYDCEFVHTCKTANVHKQGEREGQIIIEVGVLICGILQLIICECACALH